MSLSKVAHIWLVVGSESWGSFAWEPATETVQNLLGLPRVGRLGIDVKVTWENGEEWEFHGSIQALLAIPLDWSVGFDLDNAAQIVGGHPRKQDARRILGSCELPAWHEHARKLRNHLPELSRYLPKEVLA